MKLSWLCCALNFHCFTAKSESVVLGFFLSASLDMEWKVKVYNSMEVAEQVVTVEFALKSSLMQNLVLSELFV